MIDISSLECSIEISLAIIDFILYATFMICLQAIRDHLILNIGRVEAILPLVCRVFNCFYRVVFAADRRLSDCYYFSNFWQFQSNLELYFLKLTQAVYTLPYWEDQMFFFVFVVVLANEGKMRNESGKQLTFLLNLIQKNKTKLCVWS